MFQKRLASISCGFYLICINKIRVKSTVGIRSDQFKILPVSSLSFSFLSKILISIQKLLQFTNLWYVSLRRDCKAKTTIVDCSNFLWKVEIENLPTAFKTEHAKSRNVVLHNHFVTVQKYLQSSKVPFHI